MQEEVAGRIGRQKFFSDRLASGNEGPALAVVPPGMFEMGSPEDEPGHRPEEAPQHYVRIRRAFSIGRYPVTAAQFADFTQVTGWQWRSDLLQARGDYPVINIQLADAVAYTDWLSAQTGKRYRLPTEAEWEYAARAGSLAPFAFGENVSCREVHFNAAFPYQEEKSLLRKLLPRCMPYTRALMVGSLKPNLWGLYDMHGNVWELTSSPWTDSHIDAPRDGGSRPVASSDWIVTKGGSWFDPAARARSASRFPRMRNEVDVNLGFRVVREL